MASNARIFTTDGKSSSGAKTFGTTVSDRQTVPNLSQLTMVPASGSTLQDHRFILGGSLTGDDTPSTDAAIGPTATTIDGLDVGVTARPNISLSPDLTLDVARFYQYSSQLTIVIQPTDGTFLSGTYLLTSAAKGTAMIGEGFGYRLDTICSDSTMDTYINESCIVLDISSTKFRIIITPIANIDFSIDVIADVKINSAVFSP